MSDSNLFYVWLKENQVLSGVGAVVLTTAGLFLRWLFSRTPEKPSPKNASPYVSIINNPPTFPVDQAPETSTLKQKAGRELVRILFVDDDTKFRVVNILKSAGWRNVKITRDIK